jgi:hypothetical protein
MICRDRRLQDEAALPGMPFREAVRASLAASSKDRPQAYTPAPPAPVTGVRSVQRIALPKTADAEWAAHEYMRWLPRGAWPMRVAVDAEHQQDAGATTESNVTRFYLRPFKHPLLELTFAADRSASDRQLFYVTGGSLAHATTRGRLEFRVTPDGEHLLTAIHDFVPQLPWWLYRISQALVHRYVMWRFGRHLRVTSPQIPRSVPVQPASPSVASTRA